MITKNKEFTDVLRILEDVYGWNDTNEITETQAELVNDVISVVKKLTIPVVSTRTFAENQEVTYKGKKYFFKEYNPKNGKVLIANAKSVRYNDYNDWWVYGAYVC